MPNPAPKKSLGQHFLTDRNILNAVADAAEVGPEDIVVEVGPGRGTLTQVLAGRAARVFALELDAELVGLLRKTMPANVEIHLSDARETVPSEILGGCRPYKMVGNLPYYAALPILRAFLEGNCRPRAAAVLVQSEVAKQMCAKPGDMSLVSLAVQLFGEPRMVRLVRPGAFNPPPKVTSAVVGIRVYDRPAAGIDNTSAFFHLARAGFSAPRKQLHNALANGLGISSHGADSLLARAGIGPARRAETLSLAEWAALFRAWQGSDFVPLSSR